MFKIFNYIFTFSFQLIAYIPAEMYADSYFQQYFLNFLSEIDFIIAFCAMTWMDVWFYLNVSFDLHVS